MASRVSGRFTAAATLALASTMAAAPAAAQSIEDLYIFVLSKGRVAKDKVNERAEAAANGDGQLQNVYRSSIRGFAISAPAQAIAGIRANNPDIVRCEQE